MFLKVNLTKTVGDFPLWLPIRIGHNLRSSKNIEKQIIRKLYSILDSQRQQM